jgi:hypothetical protein
MSAFAICQSDYAPAAKVGNPPKVPKGFTNIENFAAAANGG